MEFVPFGAADRIKLTVKIIQSIVAVPTKSGATCSERDAIKFMMLCQAQRLNPFAGDAYLVGYDSQRNGPTFSLITAHVAMLKRAETSPDYEGMESGIILKNEESMAITEREGDFFLPDEIVVGGWAKVYRKGRKPTYRRLAMEQRRPNYPTQFWEGNKAAEQIVKCAESDALRSTFPTLLGGLYTEGERSAIIDITPAATVAALDHQLPAAVIQPQGQDSKPETAATPVAALPLLRQDPEAPEASRLEAFVLGNGFTVEHFFAWAEKTGQIPDPGSIGTIAEIGEIIAKRLMRSQAGLLAGLAKAKEGTL